MFSGIVEEMATVVAINKNQGNIDFTLTCSFTDELKIDQSVSHNGVCLTVVEIKDRRPCECRAFDADEREIRRTYRARPC